MNAHTALYAPFELFESSDTDRAALGSIYPAPQPAAPVARYGERRGPDVGALLASAGIVAALLAMFATLGMVGTHKQERAKLTVVDLVVSPPPPPPKPKVVTSPTPVAAVRSAIVAPVPPVNIAPRPVEVATTTTPAPPAPVQVSVPGLPSPPSAVAGEGPKVGDLSSKMIEMVPPRYPVESRRKREQGIVVLALTVATDGRVAGIAVSRSSGFDRLDKAALDAVRRWRWSPKTAGGEPVVMKGSVTIPFKIAENV